MFSSYQHTWFKRSAHHQTFSEARSFESGVLEEGIYLKPDGEGLWRTVLGLTLLDSHMNWCDIPVLILVFILTKWPHFAAKVSSTILGKVSTNVLVGILRHIFRSICEVTLMLLEKSWSSGPALIPLRRSIGLWSELCAGQSSSFQPNSPFVNSRAHFLVLVESPSYQRLKNTVYTNNIFNLHLCELSLTIIVRTNGQNITLCHRNSSDVFNFIDILNTVQCRHTQRFKIHYFFLSPG